MQNSFDITVKYVTDDNTIFACNNYNTVLNEMYFQIGDNLKTFSLKIDKWRNIYLHSSKKSSS